ncbi:MAG: bacteriocin family protein [Thermanaerothrix sp.]|nr:bacteriocin family protein [Thermanaerothrix sp.]
MDVLKRKFAPISDEAWAVLDQQARVVLKENLSARRFVDVLGPMGWDFHGFGTGKLMLPEGQQKGAVQYGIRQFQPMVEARVSFEMSIWDLDDISRGAKDVDLSSLEEAARKIAAFEEKAVYHGMDDGCIEGLIKGAAHSMELSVSKSKDMIMGVAKAVRSMETVVEGPFALVGGEKLFAAVDSFSEPYPMRKNLSELVDRLIYAPSLEGALLVSLKGGHMELTLGQDMSLGYESHDSTTVRLFFTETFAFRILEPRAVTALKLK